MDERGLFCPAAGIYIDPWGPVERAVLTHAHAGQPGIGRYLGASGSAPLLRIRLGDAARIETLAYGETVHLDGVRLSLHPAGHILGSSQVRLERGGEVWVVSGHYNPLSDPTCEPFEPVRCDALVTGATYGLPIFRWPPASLVAGEIESWWRANQEAGRASLLFVSPLGNAQRILAFLTSAIGPIYTHDAIESFNTVYRAAGVGLALTTPVSAAGGGLEWSRALVLAPPSELAGAWIRRFGAASRAWASGRMRIRGARRRHALDRGFVLSGHADWPALNSAIEATGARNVWVTGAFRAPMARWLAEKGLDAEPVETPHDATGEDE